MSPVKNIKHYQMYHFIKSSAALENYKNFMYIFFKGVGKGRHFKLGLFFFLPRKGCAPHPLVYQMFTNLDVLTMIWSWLLFCNFLYKGGWGGGVHKSFTRIQLNNNKLLPQLCSQDLYHYHQIHPPEHPKWIKQYSKL